MLVRWFLFYGLMLLPPAAFSRGASPGPTAESYAWRNVAIHGGGYVTGLVFHPRWPDLLYARTDVGGAYRWDARLEAWRPLLDSFDRASGNAELHGVLALALDPRNPSKVYLACGEYLGPWSRAGAILRSNDRGDTWEVTDLPFKLGGNENGRGMGERLAVDPRDGHVLFLGSSRDGLWKSGDEGRHWEPVAGIASDVGLTFVLFDPSGGTDGLPTSTLYAGLADIRGPVLRRSVDGGLTWTPVAGQPSGLLVHHAAMASGVLYLAYGNSPGPNDVTEGAVWKYEPASGRWTEITPVKPAGEDRFGYAGLSVDGGHPGTLYVSTLDRWARGDEIFRTMDGGATWTPLLHGATLDSSDSPYALHLKPHWTSDVQVDPFHPERLWFVTGYGVWATGEARTEAPDRKAFAWVFADRGLEETVVDEVLSPPVGPPLLSAVGDLGGFRHDDLSVSPAGGMFLPFQGGDPGVAFAAKAPARLVRTDWGPSRGGISADSGKTWTEFASAPEEARRFGPGLAALDAAGRRIVWVPKGSKPYYSDDEGRTWTQSHTDFVETRQWETYGPVADPVLAKRFYLYDQLEGAVYSSDDGGVSFLQATSVPKAAGVLRAEPGREGRLWLPAQEGLMVSRDGGKTFRALASVEVAYQVGFGAAAASSASPAVFLDGRVGGVDAFFRSDDGGTTWIRISDGRSRFGYIRAISGDARVYGRVYVGTSGRGILVGDPARALKP